MKKFDFRLDKVLEYRRMVEDWAKQTYLDARAARFEVEAAILALRNEQKLLIDGPMDTVEDCQTLDLRLRFLDDKVSNEEAALAVLQSEEQHALTVWQQKQRDVKAIEKLREKRVEEWQVELNRWEQAELDEWAVQRRIA